jgi:chromosome segregation ATPase
LTTKLNQAKNDLSTAMSDNEDLHRRNDDFKDDVKELTEQLITAECDKDVVVEEREDLVNENLELKASVDLIQNELKDTQQLVLHQRQELGVLREAPQLIQFAADEDKFLMFSRLMDSFEKERSEWKRKTIQLQSLLKNATNDIVYLSKRNIEMEDALSHAINWEKPIQPTKTKHTLI